MKSTNKERMLEEKLEEDNERELCNDLCYPLHWFKMLATEMHWSFIYGIVVVNGINQGLGGAVGRVASDYYWKDVQEVQPSESQVYQGITSLPWIIKPLWGLLTDILPVAGYRRRPYLILAGLLGAISMLIIWLEKDLFTMLALLLLTIANAGSAIADVTIDACIAQNSVTHPSLASDMQSLCGLSSSIGGLLGFSISAFLMDAISSQEALGLLSFPSLLVLSVGMVLKEQYAQDFSYCQIHEKLMQANKTMWKTLKCAEVWKPCIFTFASLALSLNIQEGMFYWYTDSSTGPAFSQKNISFNYSIGSIGSLLGVLLYQNSLKDYPFRFILFWTQFLSSILGFLDLVLVLRLNLKLGIEDYIFMVISEAISQMVGRVKWMPILVLSSQLCPIGIEGTFFALLMSIDHVGLLVSSWGGGLMLQLLKVTRTEFGNLWMAILIRNLLRLLPLLLLNLVPKNDQNSMVQSEDYFVSNEAVGAVLSDTNGVDHESLILH
ncbi:probable folate-biopterin transporter 2 [Dendrobium catenatum]|uniref:Putative folate-biopterin transporter 2 n=1 Tax=Dendrobium catenatum TaxID=906689 RepID=A0A2I0VSY7_9ASPA|nr:probable folate-biopterin transporter 2 [Dendrobium catenatum]PKU66526.1 putative folate-biopterin transporter 2 [Dendrobium catenatum]